MLQWNFFFEKKITLIVCTHKVNTSPSDEVLHQPPKEGLANLTKSPYLRGATALIEFYEVPPCPRLIIISQELYVMCVSII
jgi:hypothetical protein